MYIDKQLLVSEAQAVSSDGYATNVIDLGVAGRNIAAGEQMAFVVFVDTAADAADGDETYEFQIHESAASNMGSPTTLLTKAVSRTLLTAGAKVILPVPETALQYLSVYYNVGGTSPSITVTTALIPLSMVDQYKSYANNYTIS